MNILLKILSEGLTNPINIVFIILMAGVGFFHSFHKINRSRASNYIVTLGIIGTFTGITIALFNFNLDSQKLNESISGLLGGMKTAFLTSLVGLIGSLIIKAGWIEKIKKKEENKNQEGATIDTLADLLFKNKECLENLLTKNNDHLKNNNEKLENVEKALVGDGDNTLLSVMKNLKSDVHDDFKKVNEKLENVEKALVGDGENTLKWEIQKLRVKTLEDLDKVNQSLKKAIDELAKGAKEEIIQALENVIKDFNKNLTEQFGENFKQLNESVKSLVEWQEKYKEIIEESQKSHQNFIEQSNENYQKITKNLQNTLMI